MQFYRCIKEISDNPTAEVMGKWLDHPVLGKLVAAMWKTMQVQRSKQQQQTAPQQQWQQYDKQWEAEQQRRQQRQQQQPEDNDNSGS